MGLDRFRALLGVFAGLWLAASASIVGVLAVGCAQKDSAIVGHYPGELALQDWRTIARTNRPGRGEILRIVDAGRSEVLSNHIVIIQSRELPHRHNDHDSTVIVLRGQGTAVIGSERKKVRSGAVLFIPRGTIHHFTNEGDEPAVALAVFAPPFDEKDREIVHPRPQAEPPAIGSGSSRGGEDYRGSRHEDTSREAPLLKPKSSPGAVIGDGPPASGTDAVQ